MTNRTAANRYARALLDVAIKERGDLEGIAAELSAFAGLFKQYPTLEKVLLNPVVPVQRKRRAVDDLTRKMAMGPVLAKLLLLLAERDRMVLLPDLAQAYRTRLEDYRNVVRAQVTTAEPLPADRVKAVEQSLAKATGRTVTLETHVDPTIGGGVVARIGSTLYDGSVTRQLQRIKEKLAAGI